MADVRIVVGEQGRKMVSIFPTLTPELRPRVMAKDHLDFSLTIRCSKR